MTEMINYRQPGQEQPATAGGGLSGIDLARVALHQARAAAKARGEQTRVGKPKRATRTAAARGNGREVAGFSTVLQGLMADRAWSIPVAGGSVLDQWPDIADTITTNLSAHVAAAAFHKESGQLDLRPASPAYATQLRLLSARIVAAANEAIGTQAVRSIRVLADGPNPEPEARSVTRPPAAAAGPGTTVRTRDMAPAGFHRALAAHQAVPRTRVVPLDIAEAATRQDRVLRELSQWAFPDSEDEQPLPVEASLQERRRAFAATEAAALKQARAQRAQRTVTAAQRPKETPSEGLATAPAGPASIRVPGRPASDGE